MKSKPKNTKSLPVVPSKRNPYEQQEFQRKNSYLFTTPTQSVNADGSLTTYEQVTTRLRETRDKLVAIARAHAAAKDFNTDYWFLMDELSDTKKHVDFVEDERKKCLRGFTENYARMRERHHQVTDLITPDLNQTEATPSRPNGTITKETI